MFFETTNFTEDQLINKYLEIAQGHPFNLNWGTENIAANAPYMLNVFKPHGTEYTKHDIVEDTLTSLYEAREGGAKGKLEEIKIEEIKLEEIKLDVIKLDVIKLDVNFQNIFLLHHPPK